MDSFVWMIVIFVVYNVFTSNMKKNKNANKKDVQPPRPSPVQPSSRKAADPEPYMRPVASEESRTSESQAEYKKRLQKQYVEKAKKPAATKQYASLEDMPLSGEGGSFFMERSAAFDAQSNKTSSVVGAFSQGAVVNGIIMSEILGKPKALRQR